MPVTQERPREVAHDETPSNIVDHAFEPRGAWYTLCKHCGLAQAAHAETTINALDEMRKDKIAYYGDAEGSSTSTQEPLSHIGYYSDDNPADE